MAVATYVTTRLRLKLYIQNVNEPPKVRASDYLGHLTDELEEFGYSFIEEFISGGRRNFAFSVFCSSTGKRKTKCKVKFIKLNYKNSKVNFTTLRDSAPLHVHNPKQ